MLAKDDFKHLIQNAPLFAIDLVVVNEQNQILLGQRKNAPAKGYWFVPGGRVYKNESLEQAVQRISHTELGCEIQRQDLQLLGLFDHFYNDSFFDSQTSTHYINATHSIHLSADALNLPVEQHQAYRWMSLEDIEQDQSIHTFSKVFLNNLKQRIQYD